MMNEPNLVTRASLVQLFVVLVGVPAGAVVANATGAAAAILGAVVARDVWLWALVRKGTA
jgi:hypothetical protein